MRMAEYDLRNLSYSDLVLHFGGRPTEVNAFTFSNSLICIGEALQEINKQLSPEFKIEVVIESFGPGSFRAKIKASYKKLSALFKEKHPDLIIGILVWFICELGIKPMISPDSKMSVIVNDDSVIVQRGDDRVIVPRNIYDAAHKMKEPQKVRKQVAKTFSVIEADDSVKDFGLFRGLEDEKSILLIDRSDFSRIAEFVEEDGPNADDDIRLLDERARLVVIRAILEDSPRQWQFVWNGIRISAPILDKKFLPTFW